MPFERDHNRYTVIKNSRLNEAQMTELGALIHLYDIPTVHGVVIESDWGVYEDAWNLVEMQAALDEDDQTPT